MGPNATREGKREREREREGRFAVSTVGPMGREDIHATQHSTG
jgi:hypothetical protein